MVCKLCPWLTGMMAESVPVVPHIVREGAGCEEEKELGEGEREEEGRETSMNADISKSLSENPETGQSELIGEDLPPEVTSSHGDEGVKRAEEEVSSSTTGSSTVQLHAVGALLEVRLYLRGGGY